MNTRCVFLGPSVPVSMIPASNVDGIDILPPARRGDIPQAVDAGYRVIGLIDGQFQQYCAPSPKEMLGALSRGVALMGGGSMGALRAVEVEPYGMRGIGTIFHWYRQGRVHRDDDVSVLYYQDRGGYVVVNVPMVQVLWTAQRARHVEAWSPEQSHAVVRAARTLHWTDRTWSAIGRAIGWQSLESEPVVHDPKSDIKAIDALKVIQEVWKTPCTTQNEISS